MTKKAYVALVITAITKRIALIGINEKDSWRPCWINFVETTEGGMWSCHQKKGGGKDSGTIAHRLKHEYGMHPLCVTWSLLLYTNIGLNNIQNMRLSGVDCYLGMSNGLLQRKLSRLSLVMQGDHFDPFCRGQYALPYYVALKENKENPIGRL